jgi:hypothetical protein
MNLTPRDVEIIAWIGRAGGVLSMQLQVRPPGRTQKAVSQKLQRLRENGLLTHARPFGGNKHMYLATRKGLGVAGLDLLPTATVSLETAAHQVAATWLSLELEAEHGADAVVYERELRASHDHWAVVGRAARARAGTPRRHYPDFAVETADGRRLAVEVELSIKAPARLDEIMRAYGASSLDLVHYYASGRGVLRALSDAVARTVTTDRVEVLDWRQPSAI